ncbi:signal transduction histidine kinase [Nonlabens dokdonensis]|jgi:signal transduction histidine kinase|uniref:histidine kinase n=2 Tax=Nonlabens dokdonensis TaxID=328515 RepID=L7WGV1_NONDD|nr:GAF domain-containing sensor histidine kinase [Nonlabens dokdonensis]AGC78178.1 sensor protein [Nonlabens dokdonensis DSW-6]PZX37929.1 signal transduction histidine kinase [Nonlabens dokdonensis]
MTAAIQLTEESRLKAIQKLRISRDREKVFDELTELACRLTEVPRSLISIVEKDEVWFKSQKGLELNSSKRELSFCSKVIASNEEVFVIEDARKIESLENHPEVIAVDPIIFYAGVKLMSKDGYPIGAICVLDNKPHKLSEEDKNSLLMVGDLIQRQFELKKLNEDLLVQTAILEENNEMLKSFAHTVSHDMKMPLANMVLTTDIVSKKYGEAIDDSGKKYLKFIKDAAFGLSDYVGQILSHYESDTFLIEDREVFDIYTILEAIQDILAIPDDVGFQLPEDNILVNINKSVLEQILFNLIANALKYNDKETVIIKIDAVEKDNFYIFKVIDNGIGISEDKKEEIFKMFSTLDVKDRNGKKGNGIGLSTVKKLVNKLNGFISVNSELGKGTEFIITVSK